MRGPGRVVVGASALFALTAGCATAARHEPAAAPAATPAPPPGFTALFDGRDLAGWKGLAATPKTRPTMSAEELAAAQTKADEDMRQHWKADGGVLVHDGQGKNLVTARDYGDFELLVDWKIGARGDSGLYLRGTPQVQIWDPADPENLKNGADQGSGALWNNKKAGNRPAKRADRPIGEWNTFRVRMVGELVWVWLNGALVVDRVPLEGYWDPARPVPARGPIELQSHHHPLWFKNLYVREIPYEEAVSILTEGDEGSFKPIWNGRDFEGWEGPVDRYEIADGAIRCKQDQGGTIFTTEEFSDFVARLEFKLPPGGNNGLAIRYPGKGDTAYVGMCELQVLDNEDPKNATGHDPRQYHGSAYGMVAAHRGYQRPAGEWNFQQVTVRGSTIKVELNGTTILDTDLAKASDFMDGQAHPGKDRTSGHFGFAGHRDPVAFRSLRIKSLR
jgi:hypothetical protein